MDYEFVFKKGKYKGKTVDWVEDNDPSYIVWIEECKPELLEDDDNFSVNSDLSYEEKYPEPEEDFIETAIKPNLNFDNEGKK